MLKLVNEVNLLDVIAAQVVRIQIALGVDPVNFTIVVNERHCHCG